MSKPQTCDRRDGRIMLVFLVFFLDPTALIHWNELRRTGCHYAILCCSGYAGLLPANGPPHRGCMEPWVLPFRICIDQPILRYHQIRSESRGEAGLVGGLFGILSVVDLICHRGVLLVQLLDHLLEVSVDARSQVLLVPRRPATTNALDGRFV